MAPAGTERVTIALAPTMARTPIISSDKITAPRNQGTGNDSGGREMQMLRILLAAREWIKCSAKSRPAAWRVRRRIISLVQQVFKRIRAVTGEGIQRQTGFIAGQLHRIGIGRGDRLGQ